MSYGKEELWIINLPSPDKSGNPFYAEERGVKRL